jgi:hypothetical protein
VKPTLRGTHPGYAPAEPMATRSHRPALASYKSNRVTIAPAPGGQQEHLTAEELVQVLLQGGARLLATQEHGVFLEAQRHLIFLRRGSLVTEMELEDALRSAAIGPGRFDTLLADVRRIGVLAGHLLP